MVVVALLLLLPAPAKATPFLYTFSFDALPVHGLPADSFSFFVDDLLVTPGVSIAMPTGTELNGLYFSPLRISLIACRRMSTQARADMGP